MECKRIVLTMAYLFNIPIPETHYDRSWFDIKSEALGGAPGIWTHVNYRRDKSDCIPQPEFINMLNEVSGEAKTFKPQFSDLESIIEKDISEIPADDVLNYSHDLNEEA